MCTSVSAVLWLMTPGTSEHRRSALPAYSDPTYYEWDVVDTNPLGENPCPSSHLHHSASAAGMFMLAPSEHFLDKDVFSHRGKMFLFQPHHRTVLKNLWKEPPLKKSTKQTQTLEKNVRAAQIFIFFHILPAVLEPLCPSKPHQFFRAQIRKALFKYVAPKQKC